MKSFALLTLAAAAFAAPAVPVLDERQFGGGFGGGRGGGFGGGLGGGLGGRVGSTANEFTSGGCRDIIMIFARGSTEVGNMGTVVGPPVANELKSRYGADRVAAEGVPYAAALAPNALPGGTDSQSRDLMKNLITKAAADCPKSAIVVGGYSQGAAVTHRAVENLPQATKDQIAAAFTFGDTQKVQVQSSPSLDTDEIPFP